MATDKKEIYVEGGDLKEEIGVSEMSNSDVSMVSTNFEPFEARGSNCALV